MIEAALVLALVIGGYGFYPRSGYFYYCGDVKISEYADCVCGNKTLTYQNEENCCGRVKCVVEKDGRGNCSGGDPCILRPPYHLTCGGIVMSGDKSCICGNWSLRLRKFFSNDEWCCQGPEGCEYHKPHGNHAWCYNGTIVSGYRNNTS